MITKIFLKMSGRGNAFGLPPKITIPKFSRKNETPMADINAEIRGAFLKGLYATRSIAIPRKTVVKIAIGYATHQGNNNKVIV